MQAIALKGFTPESRAKFDKMQNEVDSVEASIQIEERLSESRSFERSPRPTGAHANGYNGEERRSALNQAFQAYLTKGEVRDILTTSDVTGGALIPQDFDGVLNNALKFYGPISQEVRTRYTDDGGRPLKISLGNDTANGLTLLATEGTSSPQETDPSFQSKIVNTDTLTGGLVRVSFQEVQDSYFSLDRVIEDYFALRYGRGLEKAITLGTDSAGTALPSQTAGGLLGAAPVGFTTATLAGGIGWDDLVSTFSAIDPAYLPNGKWSMSSGTRSYLLGLKDGFGRPYFIPDPANSNPFERLMGYPIVLNQALPSFNAVTPVANQTPILFGDFKQGYLLRTESRPSILKLSERYADTLEYGYFLFTRTGGISLIQTASPAVVKLALAAS